MLLPGCPIPPDAVRTEHPLNDGRLMWWLASAPNRDGGANWWDMFGRRPLKPVGATTASTGLKRSVILRPGALSSSSAQCSLGAPGFATDAMPDTGLLGAITIAAWFLPYTTREHDFVSKCASNGATNTPFDFKSGPSSTTTRSCIVRSNGSKYTQYTSQTSFPGLNQWVHLVVTCPDGDPFSLPTFYFNGVKDSLNAVRAGTQTTAGTNVTGSSSGVHVGRRADGGALMDGQLDDISIWSRALSARDVRELYDQSRQGYPDVLRRAELPGLIRPGLILRRHMARFSRWLTN